MRATSSFKILSGIFVLVILAAVLHPVSAAADTSDDNCLKKGEVCFGGTIIKKNFKWCLIKVDFFPYVIPNPVAPYFYLTHVL